MLTDLALRIVGVAADKQQAYFNPLFRHFIVLRQVEFGIHDFGLMRLPGNGLPRFADTVFIKCQDIQLSVIAPALLYLLHPCSRRLTVLP